jgi:hypothetical protein
MISRRAFINAGSLGYLGLNLGDYLKLRAEENAVKEAKAQSVNYIYIPAKIAGTAGHGFNIRVWDQ